MQKYYIKKKYLLLLAGMLILLSSTACQDWLVTPTSDQSALTPSPSPATTTATPLPQASPTPSPTMDTGPRLITLRIWVPDFLDPYKDNTGAAALSAQLDSYTDSNFYIQTYVEAKKDQGSGGLYNLLSTAYDAAPAVLPDLIVLNQTDLRLAAANGYILPLDGYELPAWDYFPFAVESVTLNDDLYGVPYLADADQVIYREGITTTAPISWTGVISGGYSIAFPAGEDLELANDALLAMYIGSGGKVADANGQPSLDRQVLESVYGFFAELANQGLINTPRALTLKDSTACWAMYQEGAADISPVPVGDYWLQIDENSRPGWIPTQDGSPAVIARTWAIAVVTADGYRYAESIKLARYLSDPENQGRLAQQTMLVPTRRQGVAIWGLLPDDTAFLNSLMADATLAYPTNIDTSVRRALQAGLVAILRQDVGTPEQAATYALTNLRR